MTSKMLYVFSFNGKKAQGLQLNTLILIILGVLILVILIAGFTVGWNKILPWIKPTNNVDQISSQCNLACSTNAKYDYCTKQLKVVYEDGEATDTCNNFANYESLKDDNGNSDTTKISLYSSFGIEKCPSIDC